MFPGFFVPISGWQMLFVPAVAQMFSSAQTTLTTTLRQRQQARKVADMKEQAVNEAVERGFLNPGQAARYLSISRRYLGHLTGIGIIPVHRLGTRCVRYARADLINAMQSFRRGK